MDGIEYRNKFIEDILADQNLVNNETIMKHFGNILNSIRDVKNYNLYKELLNSNNFINNEEYVLTVSNLIDAREYRKDEKPKGYDKLWLDVFNKCIKGIKDGKDVNASDIAKILEYDIKKSEDMELLSVITKSPYITFNEDFSKTLRDVYKYSFRQEEGTKLIIDTLEIVSKNANKLMQIPEYANGFDTLISHIVDSPESAPVLQKLLQSSMFKQNSKLYENPIVQKYFNNIFLEIKNETQAKFVTEILDNPTFYNNEVVMKNVADLINNINTNEAVENAKLVLAEEKLRNNDNVMENIGSILRAVTNEYRKEYLDKILNNDELCNNPIFMKYVYGLLGEIDINESHRKIVDRILSDENIINDEKVMKRISTAVHFCKNEGKTELMQVILDKGLLKNDNVFNNSASIRTMTGKQYQNDLFYMIFNDSRLVDNKGFMDKFCDGTITNEKQAKGMKNILSTILNDKILGRDKACVDQLAYILEDIDFVERAAELSSDAIRMEIINLTTTIAEIVGKKKQLQQHDMKMLTNDDIINLLYKKHNLYVINTLIENSFKDVLLHATEMKYKGMENFLNMCYVSLNGTIKSPMLESLNKLNMPEQKIDKILAIGSLLDSNMVDLPEITNIINEIKSPQITSEQTEKIHKIFTSEKSYDEQINEFIQEFDVPKKNIEKIRKFFEKIGVNGCIIELPSAEKQIEGLRTKLRSIEQNEKIPQDKKERLVGNLKQQVLDIETHTEKYIGKRVNDNAMKLINAQVEAHINLPHQQSEFTAKLNETLYKIAKIETTPELLNAVEYDSKYFTKLLVAAKQSEFQTQYEKMIELIKENPNRQWIDIIQELPHNIKTRKMFNEIGLDYERWKTFDENSKLGFTYKQDVEGAVRKARDELQEEFRSDIARHLDKDELEKLKKILVDRDINTAEQSRLPKIMSALIQEIKSNEYWSSDDPYVREFLDHMDLHKERIKEVVDMSEVSDELFVRIWDKNDVGRNLFFGNHVGCCTSVQNSNGFAAPQHLMNTFVNGIEIVDKAGNSVGNSMCYFAKVDGKLTFTLDSFEASGKLGNAPEVTNAVIEYAKQFCKEMGVPDANIMFGPNYNKINFSRCVKTTGHTIEVIGSAPDRTYIDCVGGRNSINNPVYNRSMHEIIDL